MQCNFIHVKFKNKQNSFLSPRFFPALNAVHGDSGVLGEAQVLILCSPTKQKNTATNEEAKTSGQHLQQSQGTQKYKWVGPKPS